MSSTCLYNAGGSAALSGGLAPSIPLASRSVSHAWGFASCGEQQEAPLLSWQATAGSQAAAANPSIGPLFHGTQLAMSPASVVGPGNERSPPAGGGNEEWTLSESECASLLSNLSSACSGAHTAWSEP